MNDVIPALANRKSFFGFPAYARNFPGNASGSPNNPAYTRKSGSAATNTANNSRRDPGPEPTPGPGVRP
ncbi:hypothetical protein, partial [Saccharopolyspora elongata]|uniref:hypothetical protein n=1 Tax=Saccharopolyspora elongata TaxID=2530387 RepID=UPI001A9E127A